MVFASLSAWTAASDRLAPALLTAAAGSVVLLGLAGAAAAAMRRASAAARHEVWLLGFAGVLLLPVLSATLPAWPVLPRVGANRQALPASEPVAVSPSAPSALPPQSTHREETPMRATSESTERTSAGPTQLTAAAATVPPAPSLPAPPAAAAAAAPAPVRPEVGRSEGLPWTAWLLMVWALGSLLVLCRVSLGHLSLWALRRRCTGVARGEMFDLLERLRAEAGIRRPVKLLSSPARTMPMTWGVWRARLLVPDQAADWPAGQRRDVLLHELGHVKRWDCLTQLLAQVACALYWFNPLAWVASRRTQVERERACDDLVLNGGAEPSSYARHLLQSVASVPAFPLAAAAVAMARPSTLEERMRAILDGRLNRRAPTARGSLAAALLLLSVLLPAAVLKAQEAPPPVAPAQVPPSREAPAPSNGNARGGSSDAPATRPAGNPLTGRPVSPGMRPGGRTFGGPGGGAGAPVLGEGPTCTLDATIYDVRMPADQIGRLDVEALAKAAETAEGFEKALAALGAAQPLYRANQSVRLSGDSVMIGSQVPVVTNTRMTDRGQAINTVQYQDVGAIFRLAGKAGASGPVDVDLGIEMSAFSDSGAQIADKVNVPVMRKATLSHKGPVQARKPFLVVSVDAASADKDGKAVAYIGRVTIGEPQAPASK